MSKIEWTDQTWNPVTGCNKVSRGCKNCYAEVMHKRLRAMRSKKYTEPFSNGATVHYDSLLEPFTWKKPRMVFVNSMSDLFHEDVPFGFIDMVFAVMALTRKHTYQILTKRSDRMEQYFSVGKNVLLERWGNATYELGLSDSDGDTDVPSCWIWNMGQQVWPYKNIWLGTSVENQDQDCRINHLLKCPAAIRFLSCEPLVGPLVLENLKYGIKQDSKVPSEFYSPLIDWVIAGGESGPKAQPMHPDWVRSLRDQCLRVGVPFFFKQWGEYQIIEDYPIPLEALGKMSHYSENGEFKPVRKDTPATVIDSFPLAIRVGKKKACNLLDGHKWEQFPQPQQETLTQ